MISIEKSTSVILACNCQDVPGRIVTMLIFPGKLLYNCLENNWKYLFIKTVIQGSKNKKRDAIKL